MHAWRRAACAALGLAWACALPAQPVYKWVDAQGRTHYGSQPPDAQPDAAPVKITPNGSSSSNAGGSRSGAGYNPDGTKKVPKEVREMEEGLAKGLQKVDPKGVPLNCAAAVSNVHSQADTMLEVGEKNLKDGYMTQAQFDATAAKVRQSRAETTVGDCQAASGAKKAFYQCMSNSYNHVLGCAGKHRH
jgi:hypothetical protein